jgi:hypothetical protein
MSALADVTPGNTADDQPPASAAPAADQPAGAIPADAQPGAAAIAPRPTIPVALLTARPGNVRRGSGAQLRLPGLDRGQRSPCPAADRLRR